MEIVCTRNRGYKWISDGSCWFKGYMQAESGEIWRDEIALKQIKNLSSFDEFKTFLSNVGGVFQLIVKRNNEIWAATDIARSMPIYYTSDFSFVTDDVSNIPKEYKEGNENLDPIRTLELYTTSFVGFKGTVYRNIKQIEIGSVAKITEQAIFEEPYFIHGSEQIIINESDALGELKKTTDEMIGRVKKVLNGRPIILSLSGGYDSRYLACSLKENHIENVICYTYGKADSFEVIQSKKVADALGYQWYNVEYTDEMVECVLEKEKEYFDYSNRPDYIIYLQNYIAVNDLHSKGIIPSDAVFITGLCNDMPTGFYIPSEEIVKGYELSNEGVAEYNLDKRFIKFHISSEAREVYKMDVLNFLNRMQMKVNDYPTFIRALDCLETANFHSHCYLNMNVPHEFFDHEWIIPCWDRQLLEFWYSLPIGLRLNQHLYELYITQGIGAQYGVGNKKHVNYEAKTFCMAKIKRAIGGAIVRIAYPLGIPLRRSRDINNFSVLEVKIYRKIKQKEAVKCDRAAIILMLTIYMMEYRYGNTWYSIIKKYLRKLE